MEQKINTYIICYDLCEPEQNYEEIIERIQKYPKFAKINLSVWIIKSKKSKSDIFKDLKPFIDKNDKLFIGTLSGATWTQNIEDTEDIKDCFHKK